MRRSTRGLHHKKGTQVDTSAGGPPLSSEGDDGDQVVRNGILYIKTQGRWITFKSGSGNINDGWHGSQSYIKILPSDFMIDNDNLSGAVGTAYDLASPALIHNDAFTISKTSVPSSYNYSGQYSNGVVHPNAETGTWKGMGAFIPIPLGYWAIAAKIYCSHTFEGKTGDPPAFNFNSGIPQFVDGHINGSGGDDDGVTAVHLNSGVQVHNTSLITGGSESLLADTGRTNTRIVFDTAMLGQEANYLYLCVNGLPDLAVVYGGYIQIKRVKTAQAIEEASGESAGDYLERGI